MDSFANPLISAGVGLASGVVGGWLNRWLERYKTKLRKSEFLFQKEFEAASEFLSLRRRLMPRYRFREMDWGDVCEDFALDFEKVEKALTAYMATHGASRCLANNGRYALCHCLVREDFAPLAKRLV